MNDYVSILKATAPEAILAATALAVLAADLLYLREIEVRLRLIISAIISGLGCVVAIGWLLALPSYESLGQGMIALDPLRRAVQIGILALALLAILLSIDAQSSAHAGEFIALVLFGAIGMLFLVASEDILVLFVSLELTSLCLYVLAAFDKQRIESAEAGLKYFLFGGVSAAFTLFGFSILYGLSGSTRLREIAAALGGPGLDPLLLVAVVMVVIGFGFKIAVAPFQFWAPDVYEGAPLPSAAFIASASKGAGFIVLAQVMMLGFKGAQGSGAWRAFVPGWVPVLATVAAISIILGNLAALAQSSVRRLLAYSAVAHAGYVLLAVMAADAQAQESIAYYALTYALTALGAFGVVAVVVERTGGDQFSDFAGLSRREPLLSLCMAVFLLSLAGIPPLAGFFGKFYLFTSALEGARAFDLLWLVALALAMSAVSLYYYLKVLKQIYVVEPPGGGTGTIPERSQPIIRLIVLVLVAAGVLALGAAPGLLLGFLSGPP
jgi:NADH-quinone oxidoreductase subunit N